MPGKTHPSHGLLDRSAEGRLLVDTPLSKLLWERLLHIRGSGNNRPQPPDIVCKKVQPGRRADLGLEQHHVQ